MLIGSTLFVVLVCVVAWLAGKQALAVYALSFWHYLLYGLAYRYGVVPLGEFKRDAMLMKAVSLLALAWVYLAAPLNFVSLAVLAVGFALNILAASALGSDRTYYGYELARLPPLRVTRFPFSVISHPMLVGNMLAYSATLLNSGFRDQWWPLVSIHVLFNLCLLAMERHLKPLRRGALDDEVSRHRTRTRLWPILPGLAATGAGFAIGVAWLTDWLAAPLAAVFGATLAIYLYILNAAYTAPRDAA